MSEVIEMKNKMLIHGLENADLENSSRRGHSFKLNTVVEIK